MTGHLSRYAKQHGSRNRGKKYAQFPLRKIVAVTRFAESLFDKNSVKFECGHDGTATPNAIRGRCKKCVMTPEARELCG